MMQADDVIEVVAWLEEAGIAVWLDGGWGIDALIGEQTRPHNDLDIIIELRHARRVQDLFQHRQYVVFEDELPTRIVLRDPSDWHVDIHTVTFDTGGGGVQQLQDGAAFRYPPQGFHGNGRINDVTVRCLTPEVQMLCHVGYEPDANDEHDVNLLHTRFGLPIPDAYQRLHQTHSTLLKRLHPDAET